MKNSPTEQDLWFLPLGGTGEIGMNVNLYGHDKHWLMVDCGVTFNVPLNREQDEAPGVARYNMVTADLSFIENRRDNLCGLVLTHAHEDHLGAVLHKWEQLRCTIYTTAFTAEVLRRKVYRSETPLELPIIVIDTDTALDIGPFSVEWIPTTHSIPDANALLISTPVAKVLHTGDWKIDASPVVGESFNKSFFKQLSSRNITAMVCDSTNANRPGHSMSEKNCEQGLGTLISQAKGRVVVTCFASNIARLVTLAKIAQATNRYMCLLGPALENMVSIAKRTNIWPDELKITPRRHIGYLPAHEILIVATGSQGEPKASLYRLALNVHSDCDLEKEDTVIFSSIVIPGNEKAVKKLTQLLEEREITVFESATCEHTIHASGHPNKGDLMQLFSWVKPKCVVPVHGEPKHLLACSEVAKTQSIDYQLVGLNGDLYSLAPRFSIRRKVINTSRIAL